ncbi:hypothetical protein Raf01_44050 [Rugosimonospora africana]|uniref:Phosphatidic acid phosphatase type 2/haloperoxidase domain-containing protein n=1 Tax=Rugosimonospora africana TaxID=556532 RepID=A0A8J3QSU8_9ACTN|nr:hypothetical protein Raf01_44050 [Rugosimonospora africana]
MATAVAFIGTSAGQWLDGQLVPRVYWDSADPGRGRLIEPALTLLYSVEDPLVLGVLILSVILLAVLRRRARAGFAGIAALLCSAGGSAVLKTVVPRPDLSVAGSTAHNSFPSGHVAAATGLLLALLLALPDRARWWLAAPGALVVSAIGTAAMIAGWHRFSDVIGGVALASLSCCLAAAALAYRRAAGRPSPGTASPGTASPGTASPGTASPGWLWRAVLVAAAGTVTASAVAAALPVAPGLAFAAAAAGGFTAVSTAATTAVLSVTRL